MIPSLIISLMMMLSGSQEKPQQPPNVDKVPPAVSYADQIQRNFSFYPGGKIEILAGASGNVKIIGWKRSSVLVEVERIVRGLDADAARAVLEQYPLQARWTQTSGSLRTLPLPPGPASLEMNLTVYVPKDKCDLNVQVADGDFAVGSVNGWIEASVVSGSIEASSLSGYFSGTTKSGDVVVEMTGERWQGHSLTALTQKGNVELRLPPAYSASLMLETRNGDLKIDYVEKLNDGEPEPLLKSEKKNARALSGKLGSGGAFIKMMTFSGSVTLSKAESPK
jgi:DUF4097 and DUF4098 domain-containing protein YvlB